MINSIIADSCSNAVVSIGLRNDENSSALFDRRSVKRTLGGLSGEPSGNNISEGGEAPHSWGEVHIKKGELLSISLVVMYSQDSIEFSFKKSWLV